MYSTYEPFHKEQEEGEAMKVSVHIRKQLAVFPLQVDFDIEDETFALLGASGCGKSMTLKCIAGIETPDEGIITINERVVFDSNRKINLPIQERKIGFVFQNYALFPNMSVEENIACGIRDKHHRKEMTEMILKQYDLETIRSQRPSHLSGGQMQRTAFARTMASQPELLLLDEPFSALDKTMRNKMMQDLLELLPSYQGLMIYVSHDNEEVYQVSETMGILDQGRLVELGHKDQLFIHPTSIAGAIQAGIENISRIHRISDHEVEALDWGITLTLCKTILEDCTHIGISSAAIIGSQEAHKNCFPYDVLRELYRLHQTDLYIQIQGRKQSTPLVCGKNALKGSRYVYMPEEALLFLS